jgi:hypothetical protein
MSNRSSWNLLEGLFEILALLCIVIAFVFFILGPFTINGTLIDSNNIADILLFLAIASGLQAIYFNFRKKEEPS